MAFVSGDPVAAAKAIKNAAKQFPTLVLKGGYMDGQVLSAEDANGLADLEGREVMLSKIAGMLKSEMSRAAAMFVAAQSRFLGVLEAYKEKLPPSEIVSDGDVTTPPVDDGLEGAEREGEEPAVVQDEPAEEKE